LPPFTITALNVWFDEVVDVVPVVAEEPVDPRNVKVAVQSALTV
jgi:hypothetical protein